MVAAVGVLALVFGLIGLVCGIMILISAFQDEVLQGILCLCVPFYVFYYVVARFEHQHKNLIVAGWLGSLVVNLLLQAVVASMAAG